MKITPLDIRRQEFNRKVRGLDPDEIETFLEMVADEYETVIRENNSLKDRIRDLDSQVASFREMEKTLQDTIVTAQKARDEAKSDAHKEAEFIVREAELKAERWIEEARQEVMALKRELATLRSYKASFIVKMRGLLNSQSELLKVLELEPEDLRKVKMPSESEEKRGDQTDSSDTVSESSRQNHSGMQSEDDREEELPPADSGQAEGPRRPNRRFYGRRNSQSESLSSPGKG